MADRGRIAAHQVVRLEAGPSDYPFGWVALAIQAVAKGQWNRAEELIGPLRQKRSFHTTEFLGLANTPVTLLLAGGQWEETRS